MAGGIVLPDMLIGVPLENLIPTDMLQQIMGRSDLVDLSAKLAWVKNQMEYAKSTALASQYMPGKGKKEAADDPMQGNLFEFFLAL